MVIDLDKCVGCGACALGCKSENNTGNRAGGQAFNWADFQITQEGKFPNAVTTVLPVLCNHCSNAACVEACPVEPKAMFKTPDGITMHNDDRCIGCQACQDACPYSVLDLDKSEAQYSVISFNEEGLAYAAYSDTKPLIPGATASGAEIQQLTRQVPPHRTVYEHADYGSTRPANVTEKCIFCAHRVADGLAPRCVEVCPAEARIFGRLDDPGSAPTLALKGAKSFRLKEEAGTQPNVHYIGRYAGRKNR
jgi:Fe-S-cluster-containing dehydrogenase component